MDWNDGLHWISYILTAFNVGLGVYFWWWGVSIRRDRKRYLAALKQDRREYEAILPARKAVQFLLTDAATSPETRAAVHRALDRFSSEIPPDATTH